MISKMEDKGSRIGIVFNGSPLFTGDSGSGESEIRKWIIENDWLECIVSLLANSSSIQGYQLMSGLSLTRSPVNEKGKFN